jgi:hypothetical protein
MGKIIGILLTVCAIVLVVVLVIGTTPEVLEDNSTTTTAEQVVPMEEQFVSLGFTEEEAEEMKVVFETVGITDISNIRATGNGDIDNLQAFQCDVYGSSADKGGMSLLFNVEKRQVCHISLNGFTDTYTGEKKSVVLYDIWNEDGTINEDAVGYKYVVDYENGKITKYEE